MTGVLAAGLATAKPIAALTLDHVIAAEGEEEKRWEDMTEEERMALPEEERERLKAEAEERQRLAEEEAARIAAEEEAARIAAEEEAKRAEEAVDPSIPEDGTNPEDPANPGPGDGTETPGDSTNPEDPANPGTGDGTETPGDGTDSEDPTNPGPGDGTETPGDSTNPEDPTDPEDPTNPGPGDGTETPGDGTETPGDGTNPEDPTDPGPGDGTETPGDSTNPDDPTNPDMGDGTETPEDPTNPEDPTDPDTGDGTETPGDGTNPEDPANPDTGDGTLPGEEGTGNPIPEIPAVPEEPVVTEETEDLAEELPPGKTSNAALILSQQIVKLPEIVEDFHFWTVARKYAFAKEDIMIREKTPKEGADEDSVRIIGRLKQDGLLYILKEEENGWLYVESGRVRGFVKAEDVVTGDEANELLERYQEEAREQAEELQIDYTGIEGTAPMAEELVYWQENEAFDYLRATVNQTVVEKEFAVASAEAAEVKEDKSVDSRTVGTIPAGGLCYILGDEGQEWIYVESGDVRGFVESQDITWGEEVSEAVEQTGEEKYSLAEEAVEPEENMACYYTLTSTKPGVPSGELRRSMIEFAAQFIGNPYVWGGTSLTNGADCSGFVQSIYKQYGYVLPRVACDQAQYGVKIPVEDALPGDLIFYAKDGYVHHVVMYAGEGKTIEAMSTNAGIVQADVREGSAVWATRVLDDNGYGYNAGDIGEVNATKDMYGLNLGNFKLTYYCSCELCCDVETGITATGAPVVEGRTIAVDPRVIPYGTQVIIGGHVFTAEDCGGAIKGNRIDIYVNDHQKALELGVNYADVYLKK